jgi:methylmalonyl-CoA/ethylmalonyl-CoA epimerase
MHNAHCQGPEAHRTRTGHQCAGRARDGIVSAMSIEEPRIEGIGQIAITVADIDRAVAFYRDVLGLRLLFRFPGLGFFDCGGVRLMLSRPEKPELAGTSILYYRVPSIQAAAAAIEARGVALVQQPAVVHRDERHELWLAFLQDSEGNHLGLMQELPLAKAGA